MAIYASLCVTEQALNRGRCAKPNSSVFSIRVKREPKPDPVKRRPPAARCFYLAEHAVPLGYPRAKHRFPLDVV